VLRHKLDKLSLIAVCCGVGFRDVARLAHYRALASCRSSAPSRARCSLWSRTSERTQPVPPCPTYRAVGDAARETSGAGSGTRDPAIRPCNADSGRLRGRVGTGAPGGVH
jgi:hypothetical protein